MGWAQKCGEFVDVTLVEKHRVDSRVESKGATASSVEDQAKMTNGLQLMSRHGTV